MKIPYDKIAIFLSGVCAIHCILLPIVVSVLPIFSATLHHGHVIHEFWFHQFILLFILPVSIIALTIGYRTHKRVLPIFISVVGLVILVATALFIDELLHHHVVPHEAETIATFLGGIIHAVGHLLNSQATQHTKHLCTTS